VGSPSANAGVLSGGRLAYGCTDLSTAWPHGGTGLGLVGQVFIRPQSRWAVVEQEETNSAVEVQWLGGTVVVGLTLESPDDNALAVLNPGGALSGSNAVVSWPGSAVAGTALTPLTNVVFTPNNRTDGRAFVIYRAVPVPDVNQELVFNSGKFLEVPFVLIAVNDGTGTNMGKLGRFSDLGALP
jgi:hypothetical protein